MRLLVTGGGGFLGGAVVRQALERGWSVTSIARGSYPELEALGVRVVRGDICDVARVDEALEGVDAVIHTAARASAAGAFSEFERTNVVGTRTLLEACRRSGVNRFVHTSSPSVVHGGGSIRGADESLPYATHFLAHYPHTKAIAEREVLASADDSLGTVALRPHLIWGPGDTQLAPRLVERARSGSLRLVDGGRARVDTVFIEDAARAHLLAVERLQPGATCSGRAYFITQGEPVEIGFMINAILTAAGEEPVTRSVPRRVALGAGWLFETAHRLTGGAGEPRLTRFAASQMATDHWFDISAARRDLGYEPSRTIEEGLEALRRWYSERLGSRS